MYKKVFKQLKKNEENFSDVFKNTEKKPCAIRDKMPHIIFSAENPLYPTKANMSHNDVVDLLRQKGYNAEHSDGRYVGTNEKSIVIHNPPKNSFHSIAKLVERLGQESLVFSDGYGHELYHTNGDHKGKHYKGKGTTFLKDKEPDNYTKLSDGTKFRHEIDFDNIFDGSDFIKEVNGSVKKSENYFINGKYMLKKAEKKTHKLHLADSNTKLVHYSPEKGMESIDPNYHGVRKIGQEAKQGAPTHRMSFYYAEGVEPESIVTTGAKSKYVVSLGDKKIYDISQDPLNLRQKAGKKAQENADAYAKAKGWVGRSMASQQDVRDAYHQAIRDAGYHGIFNSSHNDTMSNVVGMFEAMKPEAEYDMHQNDFKETSAKDHHAHERNVTEAESYEHNNPKFLASLNSKFSE